jgi:hypothetical protein
MNVLGVRRSDRLLLCVGGRGLGHGLFAVDLLLLLAELGEKLPGTVGTVVGQGDGGCSAEKADQ